MLQKTKEKTRKTTEGKLHYLCVEIYKALNHLNSILITEIFKVLLSNKPVRKQHICGLNKTNPDQVRYGLKSVAGSKI